MRFARHFWRSKEELAGDVLLWKPKHGHQLRGHPKRPTLTNWWMTQDADLKNYQLQWKTEKLKISVSWNTEQARPDDDHDGTTATIQMTPSWHKHYKQTKQKDLTLLTHRTWPIMPFLSHLSFTANCIKVKLTNQFIQTGVRTIHWQQLFTWLWWWLLLRLATCQSPLPMTVLRTTLTWMIRLHYHTKFRYPYIADSKLWFFLYTFELSQKDTVDPHLDEWHDEYCFFLI